MKRRLDKSTKLTLTYNPENKKPFELLKGNNENGRRYTSRGANSLITNLQKTYQGNLEITPEAQQALQDLETITESNQPLNL